MIEVKNTLNGEVNASIVKEYPELEEITVTPTLDGQELKPNKYGYSKITVEGIPATDVTIDPTIKEQTKTGIFKNVTVNAIEGETLHLNPSEEQQNYEGVYLGVNIKPIQVEEITTDLDFSSGDAIELTAQEGSYIKKATINKDANLSPENIKSGVTVCGVSGDVADTSDADATSEDIVLGKTAYVANEKIRGTYEPLDTSDATATAEDISEGKTAYVNGEKITGAMLPSFDTSQITSCYQMFRGNKTVKEIVGLDTSNVSTAYYMCYGCTALEKVSNLNPSLIENTYYMFCNCENLKTVGLIDMGKATNIENMFGGCTKLQNLGGFKDLGKAYYATKANANYYTLNLSSSSSLTHESLMNVINNLYDLNLSYNVANGGTLYQQNLRIGSTNKAKLTADEIAIATNKGWYVY